MQYSSSGRENLEKQPDEPPGVRRRPKRALRETSFRARFSFLRGRDANIGLEKRTNTRKSNGLTAAYCGRVGAKTLQRAEPICKMGAHPQFRGLFRPPY